MAASTKDQLLRELAKLSARGEANPNTESARKARVAAIRSELSSKHGLPEDQQDDAALELTDPSFAKKPVETKPEQPKVENAKPESAKPDRSEPVSAAVGGALLGGAGGWLYDFLTQPDQQAPEQPAQPDAKLADEVQQAKDRAAKLKAEKAALDQQPQPAAPQAPAPAAPAPAKPEPEQIDRSKLPGFSKRDEQMLRRAVQLFKQGQKGGNPQSMMEIYNGLTKGSRIFTGSANEKGDISWAPKEIQDFIQSKYNTDWVGKDKQGRTNDADWADQFKFQNRDTPDYHNFTDPASGQQWRAVNGNFEAGVPNANGEMRWVQQPMPAFVNQLPEADQQAIFPAENTAWGKLQQHFGDAWNQKPNEAAKDWHMRQAQMLAGNPNGDTYYSGTKNGQPFNAVSAPKFGGGGFATFGNTQPTIPVVAPNIVNPPVPDVDAALSVPPPPTTPKTA